MKKQRKKKLKRLSMWAVSPGSSLVGWCHVCADMDSESTSLHQTWVHSQSCAFTSEEISERNLTEKEEKERKRCTLIQVDLHNSNFISFGSRFSKSLLPLSLSLTHVYTIHQYCVNIFQQVPRDVFFSQAYTLNPHLSIIDAFPSV